MAGVALTKGRQRVELMTVWNRIWLRAASKQQFLEDHKTAAINMHLPAAGKSKPKTEDAWRCNVQVHARETSV
eukprot:311468-Amphidinium_carterae.2